MNLHENIERIKEVMGIINESYLTRLKRRLSFFPDYVYLSYVWLNPKAFEDFDEFLDRVVFNTTIDLITNEYEFTRNDINQINAIQTEIEPYVREYILKNHIDEIRDYYNR
jgi:hypothetical protein